MTTKVEKMLAQVLAAQDAMTKQMAALEAENAQLKALAATKVGERAKPNAHGYLAPVASEWVIDKGKRKGEKESVLQFQHYANPQYNFNLSRNKAAAIAEHNAIVLEWAKANPPIAR